CDFVQTPGELVEGDEPRFRDALALELDRAPDVEDERRAALAEQRLEIARRDRRGGVGFAEIEPEDRRHVRGWRGLRRETRDGRPVGPLAQEAVLRLLLADRGYGPADVVMAWMHHGAIRERLERPKRVVERRGAPAGEVGAPGATREQRVSGEEV